MYWTDYNLNLYSKGVEPGANIQFVFGKSKLKPPSSVPGYTVLTPMEFGRVLEGKDASMTILELTADEKQLYWTLGSAASNEWLLMTIPKQGGHPKISARDQFITHVAVDSESIFWIGPGKLRSMSKNGLGTPVTLNAGPQVSTNIAIDNSYLYFVIDHTLAKLPKHGGNLVVVDANGGAQNLQKPAAVAVDNDNVYWAFSGSSRSFDDFKEDGMILKLPKNGGERTRLASSQSKISDLVVDSSNVYWISCSPNIGKCQLMGVANQ